MRRAFRIVTLVGLLAVFMAPVSLVGFHSFVAFMRGGYAPPATYNHDFGLGRSAYSVTMYNRNNTPMHVVLGAWHRASDGALTTWVSWSTSPTTFDIPANSSKVITATVTAPQGLGTVEGDPIVNTNAIVWSANNNDESALLAGLATYTMRETGQ